MLIIADDSPSLMNAVLCSLSVSACHLKAGDGDLLLSCSIYRPTIFIFVFRDGTGFHKNVLFIIFFQDVTKYKYRMCIYIQHFDVPITRDATDTEFSADADYSE